MDLDNHFDILHHLNIVKLDKIHIDNGLHVDSEDKYKTNVTYRTHQSLPHSANVQPLDVDCIQFRHEK